MGDLPPAPKEPSANSRGLAKSLRDIHLALVSEGYTEAQAERMVTKIMTSILMKSLE